MYIDYEKIGNILGFGQKFFYNMKVAQNCAYIKRNIPLVKQRLKNKKKLKVLFYVYDSSRWKSQSVYDLMLKDERFEPLIVVTKNCAQENNANFQDSKDVLKNYQFFKKRGMNVELGFDIGNNKFIPFEIFEPDLIFYSHPWYVERTQGPVVCSKFALTYYIPYFLTDSDKFFFEYDLRFQRYLYRHYIINDSVKNAYASKMSNHGANLSVAGHPQLDYFYLDTKKHEKKYLIYAPHWTVCGNNIRYSTFDWSGREILEYAKKHKGLSWVFKPHPALYRFLFTSGYMTKEEADAYYADWGNFAKIWDEGDYLDLFNDSYAMITDSGSFLTEYLLTGSPIIHLFSSESAERNETVKKICTGYYRVNNLEEMYKTFDDVLIKKNDYKYDLRIKIMEEVQLKNNYCAENIIQDITGELC